MRRSDILALLALLLILTACGLGDKAEQVKQMAGAVQEAAKQAEESGNPEDAVGALLGGGQVVDPVDFRKLRALLPEALPGLERTNAGGERGGSFGIRSSKATAQYRHADAREEVNLTITDLGSVKGVVAFGLAWLNADIDRESDDGYERTTRYEGYPAHERYSRSRDQAELSFLVADRFVVHGTARGRTMDDLKAAVARIDTGDLEAMKDEGVGVAPERTPAR